MSVAECTVRRVRHICRLLVPLLLFILLLLSIPAAAQDQQDAGLFRDELEVIHLVNLERRAAGLPPLAWNMELTVAARGFARDTVENRTTAYCDHVDSQGRLADQRMRAAGYHHLDAAAENSLCSYLPPQEAVKGWMKSELHRGNILSADLREVGVGYYRTAAGAYVVLDLALDRDYAPLVINNEAASTNTSQVRLYLYEQDAGDDWLGVGATQFVLIANTPDFAGAQWEPYTGERDWTLAPGEGWRTVYIKTHDRLGRTTIVHDSIYVGSEIPDAQLSLAYATHVDEGFVLNTLAAGGYSHIHFSLNWLADDSDENFALLEGSGERINDAAAVGGNAYRLAGGSAPAGAINWASSPLDKQPAVAYFRLKIADNSTGQASVKLVVNDGSRDVAVRLLAAHEFTTAGQYQDFAVPFTPSSTGNGLIVLCVTSDGPAALDWDVTTLYTAPQPVVAPYFFAAPGEYYRSSGVQTRFVTPGDAGSAGFNFSAPIEVYPHLNMLNGDLAPAAIQINPATLLFDAPTAGGGNLTATVTVSCPTCGDSLTWDVVSSADWLTGSLSGGYLQIQVDPSLLAAGAHTATITLTAVGRPDLLVVTLPVTVLIGRLETLLPNKLFIPAVSRR